MSRLLRSNQKGKSLLCLKSQTSACPKETLRSNSIVVALEYQRNQTPKVVSKGTEDSAAAILRDARRYGVPIVTDRDLSSRLESIYVQEEIPEELFGPVAKYLLELKLA